MLLSFIVIIAVATVIVLWEISIKRKLMVLQENTYNAMCQIGVQLSGRFDALMALLDFTKVYEKHESERLIETVKSRRIVISAKSTPADVMHQQEVISDVLGRIVVMTEKYPYLKGEEKYINAMDAVEVFENMLRTSFLIYNDSVTKLNREIRMFPVTLLARILGFQQREYLG